MEGFHGPGLKAEWVTSSTCHSLELTSTWGQVTEGVRTHSVRLSSHFPAVRLHHGGGAQISAPLRCGRIAIILPSFYTLGRESLGKQSSVLK